MANQALIAETSRLVASLPEAQARTVRDFSAFLAQQAWASLHLVEANLPADETEEEFTNDLAALIQQTSAFDWLLDEAEHSYSLADAKFCYDAPPVK